MLKSPIQTYLNVAYDDMDIGIIVKSVETCEEMTVSYDVAVYISIYGD
jgi:hypothetical protein